VFQITLSSAVLPRPTVAGSSSQLRWDGQWRVMARMGHRYCGWYQPSSDFSMNTDRRNLMPEPAGWTLGSSSGRNPAPIWTSSTFPGSQLALPRIPVLSEPLSLAIALVIDLSLPPRLAKLPRQVWSIRDTNHSGRALHHSSLLQRFKAAVLVRDRVASATNRISLSSGGLALVGTGLGYALTKGRGAGTGIRDTALGLVASTPLVC
jgi:hypothetical protein